MTAETADNKAKDIAEAVAEAAVEAVIPVAEIKALFDAFRHDVPGKVHHMWEALHELVAKAEAKVAADVKEVIANV